MAMDLKTRLNQIKRDRDEFNKAGVVRMVGSMSMRNVERIPGWFDYRQATDHFVESRRKMVQGKALLREEIRDALVVKGKIGPNDPIDFKIQSGRLHVWVTRIDRTPMPASDDLVELFD